MAWTSSASLIFHGSSLGNTKKCPHPTSIPQIPSAISRPLLVPTPGFHPKDGENLRKLASALPRTPAQHLVPFVKAFYSPSCDRNSSGCALSCPLGVCPLLPWSNDGGRLTGRALVLTIRNVPCCTEVQVCSGCHTQAWLCPSQLRAGCGLATVSPDMGSIFVASQGHPLSQVCGLGQFF